MVADVVPVDEPEPVPELVPEGELAVLLVLPPVPLPVPLGEPVPLEPPELVVAVGPDDGLPEDVEPLVEDEVPLPSPL